MFNFFNKSDGAPNIAQIMMKITPLLMPGGDKKKAIGDLITEFATDKNISMVAGHAIQGLAEFQQKQGAHYVLSIEATQDNSDIVISIYERSADRTHTIPVDHIYVSKITQAHIQFLINLIFNGTAASNTAELESTGATAQLPAGK